MTKLRVTSTCWIESDEIHFSFIRAPGPGGQNVNKLATAAVLRWNVRQSASLSDLMRARLLHALQHKLTQAGELIIKASRHRTQERNRQDALNRLTMLLQHAAIPKKPRKKTKPTRASVKKRLDSKIKQGKIKSLRGKIAHD